MTQLHLADLPVLAAPMAGGATAPALVGAVAATGSLGFVPAGYRSAGQLAEDLAAVRALTSAYGANLFVPDATPVDREAVLAYRDLVAPEIERLGAEVGPLRWEDDDDWDAKIELLVAEPAPWVSFTFGLPDDDVVRRLRRAGSRLLVTVTDTDEARAAATLEPDGLVVQAAAAGGHRGTFDQRREPDDTPLPVLDDPRGTKGAHRCRLAGARGANEQVKVPSRRGDALEHGPLLSAEATVRIAAPGAKIRYTGGSKGWIGDVSKFQYSIAKLKSAGWKPRLTSNETVELAIKENLANLN